MPRSAKKSEVTYLRQIATRARDSFDVESDVRKLAAIYDGKALGSMKQKDLAVTIGRSGAFVSKFVTIAKAAKHLAAQSKDATYFGDYANAEGLRPLTRFGGSFL